MPRISLLIDTYQVKREAYDYVSVFLGQSKGRTHRLRVRNICTTGRLLLIASRIHVLG